MINSSHILQGKILVVDDQPVNVLLLEQMLHEAGYVSVSSTTNSSRVCELHLMNRYDLILLDLEMPGMDGFQVMENMKEIETGSYLPVLVITAQPDHKLRALKAGAKDFLSKPLDLAEVLLRVYNMLEVRLLHLESRKLYSRLLAEQKVSDRLLFNVLPPAIAERLQERAARLDQEGAAAGNPKLVTDSYAEVAVLFADIVEFTKFSEGASADVLAGVLNDISTHFDNVAGNHNFVKANVIGDAYLAAAELPNPVADRTIRAANMAVDLSGAVDRFNAHSRYKLKLSVGIDAKAKLLYEI